MTFDKKIVLIQLPSPFLLVEKWIAPLHLYYLQAFLRQRGFENVSVVNLGGIEDYTREIPADGDFYGISIFTPQYRSACEVSEYIKNHLGGIVIGGGHHITALPEESLRNSGIDIAVMGEGELSLFEIVTCKDLQDIPGIAYKENSHIVCNPPRPFHPNLDEFPFPDIDEIDFQQYPGMVLDKNAGIYEMSIITSRGCPYDCAFCASKAFWKRTVRFHSADYVMNAIDALHDRGINEFRFVDDNFDLNKPRLRKILARLKDRQSKWSCGMRSENVTHQTMAMMKESGLTEVSLGIESASNKILKLINKRETVETHIRAIEIIKQYDIDIKAFLMSHLPGEDQSTVDETVRFVRDQPIDCYTVSTFVPFPGTDIWQHPERYGYSFDRNQSYDAFACLNNNNDNLSVSCDAEKTSRYHKQLFDACAEKNTGVRSLHVAQNLDRGSCWKEAL